MYNVAFIEVIWRFAKEIMINKLTSKRPRAALGDLYLWPFDRLSQYQLSISRVMVNKLVS